MDEDVRKPLRFTSHESFAHRLVLSTLSGRTLLISQIRPNSLTQTGLAPHEISFLRLIEAVTNGSHIEISYTGTKVLYKPGLITGNARGSGVGAAGTIEHELPAGCERGVSYFLVPLCLLAPFSKNPFEIVLTGPGVITSATSSGDISADTVKNAILPLYAHFGIKLNLELKITKRSNPGPGGKGGGGEVYLKFGHQVRLPKTMHFLNPGRVKRIRGVAYCTGVSASNNARMIEAARGVLNPMTADTYIFSDVSSASLVPIPSKSDSNAKRKIGLGYGLSLVAESSTGALYCADSVLSISGGEVPEDVGKRCAFQLLEIVAQGGVVPLAGVPTVLTLMSMGSEDVGRVQLGRDVLGSEEVIGLARDLGEFGMSAWAIKDTSGEDDDVVVSVVGRGVGNVGRKIT